MKGRICKRCERPLVSIGKQRSNGRLGLNPEWNGSDWKGREFHKKCNGIWTESDEAFYQIRKRILEQEEQETREFEKRRAEFEKIEGAWAAVWTPIIMTMQDRERMGKDYTKIKTRYNRIRQRLSDGVYRLIYEMSDEDIAKIREKYASGDIPENLPKSYINWTDKQLQHFIQLSKYGFKDVFP